MWWRCIFIVPLKQAFLARLPKTAKRIAVLDEPRSRGRPNAPLDVKDCYYGKECSRNRGRYLWAFFEDTTPGQILSVYENVDGTSKNDFTIGIVDDVTFKSLPLREKCRWTRRPTGKVLWSEIGRYSGGEQEFIRLSDNTDKYVQAYLRTTRNRAFYLLALAF